MKNQMKTWLHMLFAIIMLSACSAAKETGNEVQDELSDFRSWVNTTTSNVASRSEEDWKQAKADFRMRTQELDQKQENFSEELQQDYQALKQQFTEADEMYARSQSDTRRAAWERDLLGQWADLATVNERNVREPYITFMENVRAKHDSWSDEDWEMAKAVMEKLNARKQSLTGDIPTDSEVKIKALQIEFRALETGADVGDGN